jgi:hypothetical protein
VPIKLLHDSASAVALGLRQQIVIPFSICIRTQVRLLSSFSNDAYVALFAGGFVNRVELVDISFDLLNCRFSGETPLLRKIPNVSDIVVRALTIRLVDACDFVFCHNGLLCSVFRVALATGATGSV